MVSLAEKRCLPCMIGTPSMPKTSAERLLAQLDSWQLLEDAKKISKSFKFRGFLDAVEFVNKVAQIAQEEGHHPDISIYYNKVELVIFTHKIDGLTESDFILAAKIDKIQ